MRIIVGGEGVHASLPIVRSLDRAGHAVDQFDDWMVAVDGAKSAIVDAILLYPKSVDAEMLRSITMLRARKPYTVIFVALLAAGRGDICALLDAGADDVVGDLGATSLLLGRLTASVRRAWGHATPDLVAGPVTLRLGLWECEVGGRVISLTKMEYRLLEALALRRGQPVSRTALLELLYSAGREPFAKSIDLFVHNIRRKLASADRSDCLETWGKAFLLRDTSQSRPALAS